MFKKLPVLRDNISQWKFHLSINEHDLEKAWDDIILPLFKEQGVPLFKIVDVERTKAEKISCQNVLNIAEYHLKQLIKHSTEFDTASRDELESILLKFCGFYANYKTLISFDMPAEVNFTPPIDNIHDLALHYQTALAFLNEIITEINLCIESHERFMNGMQITIYTYSDQIDFYQELACKLEQALFEANIKPGDIHKSDKPLGIYCSLRHEGQGVYKPAISVSSYNPDDVEDPFKPLLTQWAHFTRRARFNNYFFGISPEHRAHKSLGLDTCYDSRKTRGHFFDIKDESQINCDTSIDKDTDAIDTTSRTYDID